MSDCSYNSCAENNLKTLSYEQLLKCLTRTDLRIKEIDLFMLTWRWIINTILNDGHRKEETTRGVIMDKSSPRRSQRKINKIRSLIKQIRFALISPNDLVNRVQGVHRIMTNDTFLRHLVLNALNYHVMPTVQSSLSSVRRRRKGGNGRTFPVFERSFGFSEDEDDHADHVIFLIYFSTFLSSYNCVFFEKKSIL